MTTKKKPAPKNTAAKSKASTAKAPKAKTNAMETKAVKSAKAETNAKPAAELEVAPVTTAVAEKAEPQLTLTVNAEAPAPQEASKKDLTIGMLQKRLHELGYYHGMWDGHYGPLTAQAVGHFQYRNGLHPDGHATNKTLSALGF